MFAKLLEKYSFLPKKHYYNSKFVNIIKLFF